MSPRIRTVARSSTGITAITVCGYKSLVREQRLEIRPLTVLAGANSSGKSSAMQPLLLLKQTLEATYDPGPLLLNGPNVRFTSAGQFLSRTGLETQVDELAIGVEVHPQETIRVIFKRKPGKALDLEEMTVRTVVGTVNLQRDMAPNELKREIGAYPGVDLLQEPYELSVTRGRCFFDVLIGLPSFWGGIVMPLTEAFGKVIEEVIHVPALRGIPERTYPITGVGHNFPGTFENYAASMVTHWQRNGSERLTRLRRALDRLGLTWTVEAEHVDETQVELRVGRVPRSGPGNQGDLVNVADVGYGVSQVLPVLVALLAAEPGQLVYVEQPELHLHPKAQSVLAEILAAAAKRGVRVVAETHSDLLLLGLQTLVAEGKLAPALVKLHWFTRSKDGSTSISSADLDERGAFGPWPVDFAAVAERAESRYLDAGERPIAK